jgi:hypothetical protein
MEELELVYRAAGLTEAEVVRSFLESEGIPVVLDYESTAKIYGLTMDGLGEVRVCVPAGWAAEAREAIGRHPDKENFLGLV